MSQDTFQSTNGWFKLVAGVWATVLIFQQAEIMSLRSWQDDYTRGKIPSSAEPEITGIKEKFAEVETQFRAFKERMIENEGATQRLIDVSTHGLAEQLREISTVSVQVEDTRELAARLDERIRAIEHLPPPICEHHPSLPLLSPSVLGAEETRELEELRGKLQRQNRPPP